MLCEFWARLVAGTQSTSCWTRCWRWRSAAPSCPDGTGNVYASVHTRCVGHAGPPSGSVMDRLSAKARSALMARVRSRNTAPEIAVRRLLHKMGCRFRLHREDLPGSPDVVLPKYRTAIFVHGCFWHRHSGCRRCSTPRSNVEFWEEKFRRNVLRDSQNLRQLEELGWRAAIIWECETKSVSELEQKLHALLHQGGDIACGLA